MGAFISMFVIIAFFYTNSFNTAYLPINSNKTFDHFGKIYNVSRAIDQATAIFDSAKYEAYSPPFLSASYVVVYMFFFAVYSATVTYGILYHRREIMVGFRQIWKGINLRKKKNGGDVNNLTGAENAAIELDVHNRLMKSYAEVPEWCMHHCSPSRTCTDTK